MIFSKAAILGSAALAIGLTFSLPQSAIISLGPDTARADVDISVNVGTFYDDLSPYGDWVNHSGAYVFIPAGVSTGWRPYTLGHWEYTRRYGWIWVSNERFGWATYHYGRWGYGDDIGWYWVPATRWAPAWVSWRRSNDYVAWAPLPPDRDVGFSINIDIDSDRYADRYWAVVPSRNFLDVDIGRVVYRDRDRFRRAWRETRPLGRVRVENTIVVNNVISVTEIERVTRKKVRAKEIREVRDEKRARQSTAEQGDTIDVFAPESKKNAEARPRKVKTVEEVAARKRKNQGEVTEDQATGNVMPDEGEGNANQATKRKKDSQQNASQGETGENGQALTKKQRRKLQQSQEEGGTAVTKKKRRQIQQSEEGSGNQAIKRKANRNEKAMKRAQKKQQGNQQNQNQNRKRKQNCVQGAANCPG